MEAVILCGVQGAGKTTLYRDRFLETHVRVAMDLLRTRAREEAFVRLCLARAPALRRRRHQPHARRPPPLRRAGARGRLPHRSATSSRSTDAEALARNAARAGRRRVPAGALVGTGRRLLRPTPEEGFDELWHATAAPDGGWRIEPLLVTPPLPGL